MRIRASFRPDLSVIKTVKNEEKEIKVEKVVENYVKKMPIKRKSLESNDCESKTIKMITIDDSEDDIEFEQTIDSLDDSSDEIQVIDKDMVINGCDKRCDKCLNGLKTREDYNCLTSADFYFNCRAHPSVIATELRDKNRFEAFKKAIDENKHVFKDKVVLIVGSGVGLLGLFAAKAGAQTVIIIDKKEIIELIEEVIRENRNNLDIRDSNIIVMNEKIESMVLPKGINNVDIIVSDWVNHLLFYKSMIQTFIYARDKWLKKNGLIFPDSGNMYLVGAHDYIHKHVYKRLNYSKSTYNKHIDWWATNIYDFNFKSIRDQVLRQPIYQSINKNQVVTKESLLKHYNFYNLTLKDLNIWTPFTLEAIKHHYLQCFVIFFEVIFVKNISIPLMYSTRPDAPKTCFNPTIFFMDNEKELIINENDKLNGDLRFTLNEDLSRFTLDINFKFENRNQNLSEKLEFKSS